MLLSDDMTDLLRIFEKLGVRYAVVGGYAVNYYGYTRVTQDIDLLIYPSPENAAQVMAALAEFGFGGAGIPQSAFERTGTVVHLGVEPNRIDLLTHLEGVSNDQVFTNIRRCELGLVAVDMISLPDLLAAKRSSKRPRDRADAAELEAISGRGLAGEQP